MSSPNEEPWYKTFNDIFFITLATALFGFGGVVVNSVIKSKCRSVSCCWNAFRCERDLENVDQTTDESTSPTAPPPQLPPRLNRV